jgi:thymidylate synthase
MIAQQANLDVGDFVWTGGDVHLYNNTLEQAELQMARTPYALPKLVIKRRPESIFDYEFDDFEVVGYESHPHIKAEVSV